MKCVTPSLIHTSQGSMVVPCNRCMACRINKTQEWSLRLLYESEKSVAVFVTLTYDDEHLPSDLSLHKDDMQRFIKRVRKRYAGNKASQIKYYLCGEYGPSTLRPHYHLCLFGVDFEPETWVFLKHKEGRDYYYSPTLSELWPFGFNTIDYANKTTMNYVTGYIQKKLYGEASQEYKERGVIPPFQLFSRNLGVHFVDKQKGRILNNGYVSYYGKRMPIPKYYSRKIGLSDQITEDGVNLRSQLAFDAETEAKEKWLESHPGKSEFDYADYVIAARLQKKIDMAAREKMLPSRGNL